MKLEKEPNFTAEEMNLLTSLSRKEFYYDKCLGFVDQYIRNSLSWKDMTEKQQKWLWGIKKDLEDELKERYGM